VAEQPLRETGRCQEGHLRYLDEENVAPVADYDPRVATRLVEEHAWLVDRLMARIAARWPEEVDVRWVHSHATVALKRAAASVENPGDLPLAAARAIRERLRTLLGGTEWYRAAMLGNVRPLCEAWRGAVLAGREPSDQTLCARLKASRAELGERFVELAAVFAVEPAALLPCRVELEKAVAMAVGGIDAEQQLVVSLYVEQQFTLAEIAEVLDILPVRAQELLGRAAAAIAGEIVLSSWPAMA